MENRITLVANIRTLDGERPKLAGYAAVFNSRSELLGGKQWGFYEVIAPGAFKRSLEAGPDVIALVDHETSMPLGRRSKGTLIVREDAHGLYVEVDPPDTTYARDLLVSIKRGDVQGMSFRFETDEDAWDDGQTPPLRTLRSVTLSEVSFCSLPAYPDTTAAARSFEATFSAQRARDARLRLAEI